MTLTFDSGKLSFISTDEDPWWASGKKKERTEEAAWVGIEIDNTTESTAELKSITKNGTAMDISGHNEYFTKELIDDKYDIWTPITLDDVQKAVMNNGTYSVVYVVTWEKDEKTYSQTITINVNANKIEMVDERGEDSETNGETIWDEKTAKIYKLEHPATATPAEENKTTEENKKDDVPKTGEVICIRRR